MADYLQEVPLFSALGKEDLARLASTTSTRRLGKGDALFHEGDEASGFYLLTEGRIKVFKITADGREQILHFISPGETFGEGNIEGVIAPESANDAVEGGADLPSV